MYNKCPEGWAQGKGKCNTGTQGILKCRVHPQCSEKAMTKFYLK